jgi:hypothetical protein
VDLRVGVLDLLEASRRFLRTAVVIGMVELHETPIGGAELGVRDCRAQA